MKNPFEQIYSFMFGPTPPLQSNSLYMYANGSFDASKQSSLRQNQNQSSFQFPKPHNANASSQQPRQQSFSNKHPIIVNTLISICIVCVFGYASFAFDQSRLNRLQVKVNSQDSKISNLNEHSIQLQDIVNDKLLRMDSMIAAVIEQNSALITGIEAKFEAQSDYVTNQLSPDLFKLVENYMNARVTGELQTLIDERIQKHEMEKEDLLESEKELRESVAKEDEGERRITDLGNKIVINVARSDYGAQVIKFQHWTTKDHTFEQKNVFTKFMLEHVVPFVNSGPYKTADRVIDSTLITTASNIPCYKSNLNFGSFGIQLRSMVAPYAFAFEYKIGLSEEYDQANVNSFQVFGMSRNYSDIIQAGKESGELIWHQKFLGFYNFSSPNPFQKSPLSEYNNAQQGTQQENDTSSPNEMQITMKDNVVRLEVKCQEALCRQEKFDAFKIEFENKGNQQFTCIYKFEVLVEIESI